MSKVIFYALRQCPTCDKARSGLRQRGIDFEEHQVNDNPQWWKEALKYSFTVPVIIWDGDDVEIGWEGEHGCEITWGAGSPTRTADRKAARQGQRRSVSEARALDAVPREDPLPPEAGLLALPPERGPDRGPLPPCPPSEAPPR